MLALRPIYFIPGLVGIIGMSVGIEFLQKFTGRSFDVTDMAANATGVAVGGLAGLMARGIYAYISREWAAQRVHKRLVRFEKDEILVLRQIKQPDVR